MYLPTDAHNQVQRDFLFLVQNSQQCLKLFKSAGKVGQKTKDMFECTKSRKEIHETYGMRCRNIETCRKIEENPESQRHLVS